MTFAYECHTDALTVSSADGKTSIEHIISNTDSIATEFTGSYHTYTNCPLTTKLEVQDATSGAWVDYTLSPINNIIGSYTAADGTW